MTSLLLKNNHTLKDFYKLWTQIMKLSINNDYFILKHKYFVIFSFLIKKFIHFMIYFNETNVNKIMLKELKSKVKKNIFYQGKTQMN